jgi:hypothetical protein
VRAKNDVAVKSLLEKSPVDEDARATCSDLATDKKADGMENVVALLGQLGFSEGK